MSEKKEKKQGMVGVGLDAVIEKVGADENKGIFVQELNAGDVITVKTRNHIYMLKVLNPKERKVEVASNGQYFKEPTITYVVGSRLVGTMVRIGWIAIGYSLELGRIVLTPTQSVAINGAQVLPATGKTTH